MKKLKTKDLIIITILLLIVLVTGFMLLKKNLKIKEELKEVKETNLIDVYKDINDISISSLKEKYNNDDIVALLEIKSLDILMPIVKTNDNDYYLNHSLYKNESFISSVPFIDYRQEETSKQINIYGHNSSIYNLPFKKLEKYLDHAFYENNKDIYFKYNDTLEHYEIFSVAIVNKSSKEEHMKFTYESDEEYKEHFKRLKKMSIYEDGVIINNNEKVLVLQTCLFGKYYNKLLIISAKKIAL